MLATVSAAIPAVGDVYIVEDTGLLKAWVGDEWVTLNGGGSGGGGQADWAENNAEEPSYVQNRTHYKMSYSEDLSDTAITRTVVTDGGGTSRAQYVYRREVAEGASLDTLWPSIMSFVNSHSYNIGDKIPASFRCSEGSYGDWLKGTEGLTVNSWEQSMDTSIILYAAMGSGYPRIEVSIYGSPWGSSSVQVVYTDYWESNWSPVAFYELELFAYQTLDSAYLPKATDTAVGAVKVGGGLSIDASGVLSTKLKDIYNDEGTYPIEAAEFFANGGIKGLSAGMYMFNNVSLLNERTWTGSTGGPTVNFILRGLGVVYWTSSNHPYGSPVVVMFGANSNTQITRATEFDTTLTVNTFTNDGTLTSTILGKTNPQTDWTEDAPAKPSYIRNKPFYDYPNAETNYFVSDTFTLNSYNYSDPTIHPYYGKSDYGNIFTNWSSWSDFANEVQKGDTLALKVELTSSSNTVEGECLLQCTDRSDYQMGDFPNMSFYSVGIEPGTSIWSYTPTDTPIATLSMNGDMEPLGQLTIVVTPDIMTQLGVSSMGGVTAKITGMRTVGGFKALDSKFIKIDNNTIKVNANGELYVDPSALGV